MDTIIPLRRAGSTLRPRRWLCAPVAALAAILLLTPGAFADLPNQADITKALKEMTEAETEARDNIPGNPRVKDAEDALDAAKRANEDTSSADATAKAAAEAAEAAAQTAADGLRTDLEGRTSDDQKARAKKYREALDKRRAARKKLQELLAQLRVWFGNRRDGVGGTQELEDAINLLRPRIGQSELPVTRPSTAGLMPSGSVTANVSTDGQRLCTFGKADPTQVALAPADDTGTPLINKMLASLPLMAGPGGAKVPENAGNPAPSPKADKPQTSATPQAGTTPSEGTPKQEDKPQTPATPQAGTPTPSGGAPKKEDKPQDASSAPQEAPAAGSGVTRRGGGIREAAGILFGLDDKGMADVTPPPPAPPDARQPSVLDNVDNLLDIFKRERQSGSSTSTPGGTAGGFGPLPPDPFKSSVKPQAEFGTPSPGASLEPIPQLDPEMLKKPWERNPWQTPSSAGQEQKPAGDKTAPGAKPSGSVQSSLQSQAIDKSTAKEPISKSASGVGGGGGGGSPGVSDPNIAYAGTVTLHFKATESVMTAGTGGPELKTQLLAKLVPVDTPAQPKTGQSKTQKAALDKDYDSSPVTCVLDKSGRCKAQLAANQRKIYGLPENDTAHYAAELNPQENTGGVLEGTAPATGRTASPGAGLPQLPPGVQVTTSEFKVGGQSFTRYSITAPDAATAAAVFASIGRMLGPKFSLDACGEKKPGPPLGMAPASFSALNRELPKATLTLRRYDRQGASGP